KEVLEKCKKMQVDISGGKARDQIRNLMLYPAELRGRPAGVLTQLSGDCTTPLPELATAPREAFATG
ncbi:MAG: hypothetical protein KDI98_03310, partial [Hyphomicrobiaceae bacterium]|nr:hypothetical protein [Hyphomicrobiaceae bacterium]